MVGGWWLMVNDCYGDGGDGNGGDGNGGGWLGAN